MKKSCDFNEILNIPNCAKGKMASSLLSVVHFVSKSTRPQYTPEDDADYDYLFVLSIGVPIHYIIPSFQLLSVELRQMGVKGYTKEDEEKVYDVFVRK